MDVTSYLLGKKAGGGGEAPTLINKNISANGTYNASSDEADGYKKVVVEVQPNLETKSITITENKTTLIEPTQGKDGISSVSVITNVPQSGGRDWTAIGYSSEPQSIVAGYNYAKNIYDNWDSSITTMASKYNGNRELIFMPSVDTSNVNAMNSAFAQCTCLQQVGQIDTSRVANFNSCFYQCGALYELPKLDFSKASDISGLLIYCYGLTILGGFENLGEEYYTGRSAGYSKYQLNLSECTLLTHDSLTNVINNLYDIATKGCNSQGLVLGATNLAKLTAEEISVATNNGWTVS